MKRTSSKSSANPWKNFGKNIRIIYLYGASFVGLMFILGFGIVLADSFLESKVFGVDHGYINYRECEQTSGKGLAEEISVSEEEIEACEERLLEHAKEDYAMNIKRSYAEGVSGVLFGLLLWAPHFTWARREK